MNFGMKLLHVLLNIPIGNDLFLMNAETHPVREKNHNRFKLFLRRILKHKQNRTIKRNMPKKHKHRTIETHEKKKQQQMNQESMI